MVQTTTQDHLISNGIYNKLKPVATTVLPAMAALYITLASLWELPNPDKVAASIAAVNAFLGVILGISTKSWNNSDAKYDGDLTFTGTDEDTGYPDMQLLIKRDPNELAEKNTIRLKSFDQR